MCGLSQMIQDRPSSLQPLTVGDTTFEPGDRFFADVITQRKRLESTNAPVANGLKLLANSGCYGIGVEFNPKLLPHADAVKDTRLCAETESPCRLRGKTETPGNYANPFVASLVTAGGRLLLALLQREVAEAGGSFVWVNTDAMAVVIEPGVPQQNIPGVTSDCLRAITERFQALSPYPADIVPAFLRIESEGTAYAIAPNSYCLRVAEGKFTKATMTGMGGVVLPNGQGLSDFSNAFWEAVRAGKAPADWNSIPLRMKFPIRKPATLLAARRALRNNPVRMPDDYLQALQYAETVKPFNFLQTVASAPNRGARRQVIGPYLRDPKATMKAKFWNSEGERVSLSLRYEPGTVPPPCTIFAETLADFYNLYVCRTDVKMVTATGEVSRPYFTGRLFPRPIKRTGSYLIGKEIDRLATSEDSEAASMEREPPLTVRLNTRRRSPKPPKHLPGYTQAINALATVPAEEAAKVIGICVRYWREIRGGKIPREAVQRDVIRARQELQAKIAERKDELQPPSMTEIAEATTFLSEHPPSKVAPLIGVSARQWRNIRAGTKRPGEETARRILSAYREVMGNG